MVFLASGNGPGSKVGPIVVVEETPTAVPTETLEVKPTEIATESAQSTPLPTPTPEDGGLGVVGWCLLGIVGLFVLVLGANAVFKK